MKLFICAVGRAKPSPERDLLTTYLDRLRSAGGQCGITGTELIEVEERKQLSPAELKLREGKMLLSAVPKGAVIIALDERGKTQTSQKFTDLIARTRDNSVPAMAFLIGGADGLSQEVRDAADQLLSFGAVTWPHMLVRAMIAEQLYRSVTIMTGHPYHREG